MIYLKFISKYINNVWIYEISDDIKYTRCIYPIEVKEEEYKSSKWMFNDDLLGLRYNLYILTKNELFIEMI